jgi:hypothetical protein
MPYELPDATTPFRSQAELVEHLSSPRYANDTAYRAACEAKLVLGLQSDDAPTTSVIEGARSTVDPFVGERQIELPHGSMQKAQEIVTLQREIAEMEGAAEAQKQQTLAVLRIPKAPPADTSKPAEPFASTEEMQRHMSDPRYRSDAEFVKYVEDRMAASDDLPGVSSKHVGETVSHD